MMSETRIVQLAKDGNGHAAESQCPLLPMCLRHPTKMDPTMQPLFLVHERPLFFLLQELRVVLYLRLADWLYA